jgi:hypothetical protein
VFLNNTICYNDTANYFEIYGGIYLTQLPIPIKTSKLFRRLHEGIRVIDGVERPIVNRTYIGHPLLKPPRTCKSMNGMYFMKMEDYLCYNFPDVPYIRYVLNCRRKEEFGFA